jgi:hypothetical protein
MNRVLSVAVRMIRHKLGIWKNEFVEYFESKRRKHKENEDEIILFQSSADGKSMAFVQHHHLQMK